MLRIFLLASRLMFYVNHTMKTILFLLVYVLGPQALALVYQSFLASCSDRSIYYDDPEYISIDSTGCVSVH